MKQQGIICINKPMEWTSHDVVAAVRRKLHIKRVGHTGTLDPMATGVLPVAFGKATRMIEYFDADLKTYRAEMQLGLTTDTLDITGEVLERTDASGVTEEAVREALAGLCGEILQTPPRYSAVKVNGRRLYEYARKGQDVEIRPRKAYIEDIYDIETDLANGRVAFSVDCAKGTYVRSICDDAGRMLGVGAAKTALTRTASGVFTLEGSITMEELLDMTEEELDSRIIPIEETLQSLGEITLKGPVWAERFMNGQEMDIEGYETVHAPFLPVRMDPDSRIATVYRILDEGGAFLGTGRIDPESGLLRAEKVIAERENESF